MKSFSVREASDRKVSNFETWLLSQGLERRPVTNEFEVFRFISTRGVLVLYRGKRGYSVNSPLVNEAWDCFVDGKGLSWKGRPGKRSGGSVIKRALLNRDGDLCFYCGDQMEPGAATQEHLLSIVHGGPTRIENMVLCCKPCNLEAGHLSIIEKVALREAKRFSDGRQLPCQHFTSDVFPEVFENGSI